MMLVTHCHCYIILLWHLKINVEEISNNQPLSQVTSHILCLTLRYEILFFMMYFKFQNWKFNFEEIGKNQPTSQITSHILCLTLQYDDSDTLSLLYDFTLTSIFNVENIGKNQPVSQVISHIIFSNSKVWHLVIVS